MEKEVVLIAVEQAWNDFRNLIATNAVMGPLTVEEVEATMRERGIAVNKEG